jgi:DNA polymerase-1
MSLVSPRIFLVDTFGLIFRAYYGRARSSVGSLRTSAGMPTEAVYVFNNMLKVMLEEQRPDYVVAVWEGRGPTFREDIFPE